MKANIEIRQMIDSSNLKHWEVAEKVGVCHYTFSVWLRKELPQDKRDLVIKAIEDLKEERK